MLNSQTNANVYLSMLKLISKLQVVHHLPFESEKTQNFGARAEWTGHFRIATFVDSGSPWQ